jgi:hypothetical protein
MEQFKPGAVGLPAAIATVAPAETVAVVAPATSKSAPVNNDIQRTVKVHRLSWPLPARRWANIQDVCDDRATRVLFIC